jgi:hypothetical protein
MERTDLLIPRHMRRMSLVALVFGALLPMLRTCTPAAIHLIGRTILGWR